MRSSNSKPGNAPSTALIPSSVAYSECKTCGFTGPIDMFNKRGQCLVCYEAVVADKPVLMQPEHPMQQREAFKAVESLIRQTRAAQDATAAPSVGELVNEMLTQFGGVKRFARSWHSAVKTAKMSDPGSPKVLRAHEQIAKLLVDANRLKTVTEDASSMTDDQIRDELVRLVSSEITAGRLQITSEG